MTPDRVAELATTFRELKDEVLSEFDARGYLARYGIDEPDSRFVRRLLSAVNEKLPPDFEISVYDYYEARGQEIQNPAPIKFTDQEQGSTQTANSPEDVAGIALSSLTERPEIATLRKASPRAREDAVRRSLEYARNNGTVIATPDDFADNMVAFLKEHKMTRQLLEASAARGASGRQSGQVG